MKSGDRVFKVARSFRGVLSVESSHVRAIGVDVTLTTREGAWQSRVRVARADCHATPQDAAMAYIGECNDRLEAAERAVDAAKVEIDRARAFAVSVEAAK